MQRHLPVFSPQNCYPAIFGGHIKILCKCKNVLMSESVRERAISAKFLAWMVCAKASGHFPKKLFSTIFGSHHEFLHKMQKHIHLGTLVSAVQKKQLSFFSKSSTLVLVLIFLCI